MAVLADVVAERPAVGREHTRAEPVEVA
jgi:hypothetical protein